MSGTVSNDQVLSMEVISNMRLKMFNRIVKTLECWHVLEIIKESDFSFGI